MSESGNDSADEFLSYPSSFAFSSSNEDEGPTQEAAIEDYDLYDSSSERGNSDVQEMFLSGSSYASADEEKESSSRREESDDEASSSAEADDDCEEDENASDDDMPVDVGSLDFIKGILEQTGFSSVIKFNQTMITTKNVSVTSANSNGPAIIIEVETGVLSHFFSNVSGNEMKIHVDQESLSTDTGTTNSNNWIGISCTDESKIEEIEMKLENGSLTISIPK